LQRVRSTDWIEAVVPATRNIGLVRPKGKSFAFDEGQSMKSLLVERAPMVDWHLPADPEPLPWFPLSAVGPPGAAPPLALRRLRRPLGSRGRRALSPLPSHTL
jgi:hypothetical protein